LTSIINLMDLDDSAGSHPLDDLDFEPDPGAPGPREPVDSDASLASFVQSLSTERRQRGVTPPPLDPSEMLPTSPRRLEVARPDSPPPPMQVAKSARKTAQMTAGSTIRPWMVIAVIVVVAIVATLIVAMSGPSLPGGK